MWSKHVNEYTWSIYWKTPKQMVYQWDCSIFNFICEILSFVLKWLTMGLNMAWSQTGCNEDQYLLPIFWNDWTEHVFLNQRIAHRTVMNQRQSRNQLSEWRWWWWWWWVKSGQYPSLRPGKKPQSLHSASSSCNVLFYFKHQHQFLHLRNIIFSASMLLR